MGNYPNVADNVDHDIRTLNGLDTFHSIGTISACVHLDGSKGVLQIDLPVIKKIPSSLLSADIAKDACVPVNLYTVTLKSGLGKPTFTPFLSLQYLQSSHPFSNCHCSGTFAVSLAQLTN